LAGVIMWIPAGGVYAVAALWLFTTWLRLAERSALARERAGESWVSGGARLDQDR
jgi:cytochrome c oxidase assembly factor CtaG